MANTFKGTLELIIFTNNLKQYSRAFKEIELTFQPYEKMVLSILTSEYKISKLNWNTKKNSFRAISLIIDNEMNGPSEELKMAKRNKFSDIQPPEATTEEMLDYFFPYESSIEQPLENSSNDSFYLLNAIYRKVNNTEHAPLFHFSSFLGGIIIGGIFVYLLN